MTAETKKDYIKTREWMTFPFNKKNELVDILKQAEDIKYSTFNNGVMLSPANESEKDVFHNAYKTMDDLSNKAVALVFKHLGIDIPEGKSPIEFNREMYENNLKGNGTERLKNIGVKFNNIFCAAKVTAEQNIRQERQV